MIAVKDENGYVRGNAETIARMANVSVEATAKALEVFQEKDLSSHTPDNDGRRIAPAPGGWIILNHELYRTGDRTAYMRDYMREYRAKKDVNSVNVNVSSPSVSASASVSEEDKSLREGTKFFEAFDQMIPETMKDPRFLIAWHSWVVDRKERRKALTIRAAELQLAKLKDFGIEKAIRAIDAGIEKSWSGIFDPDGQNAVKPVQKAGGIKISEIT
jgi:hypothetical protein